MEKEGKEEKNMSKKEIYHRMQKSDLVNIWRMVLVVGVQQMRLIFLSGDFC